MWNTAVREFSGAVVFDVTRHDSCIHESKENTSQKVICYMLTTVGKKGAPVRLTVPYSPGIPLSLMHKNWPLAEQKKK